MALPKGFLSHLRAQGYHPRSDKHSNAIATEITKDFLAACRKASGLAAAGELVYDLNFDLRVGTSTWNSDLVIGRPAAAMVPSDGLITKAPPSTVEIAVELKAVMTEHRKAVKNRKRDLEAHHEHVANYSAETISGGVLLLNQSVTFRSPTRAPTDITTHAGGDKQRMVSLVEHCVNEMRNVTERSDSGRRGMDAKCVLIVEMDNIDWPSTSYHTTQPAPRPGDPLHYDSFIQKLCNLYLRRFAL